MICVIPLNTDNDGNCSCLKANYYKMGLANFIRRSDDGFKATCIMEFNNKRLQQMVDKDLIPNIGGCFIDAYNQTINKEIAGTITTRVDASNMSFVTEPRIIDVRAVGRERTEEEKARRRKYGDKGAKFSKGKKLCFLGDISGCITTLATKDNLVGEFYESIDDKKRIEMESNISNTEPLIIDDYNQRIPQDQDVIGTVTTQFGNPAPRHGYKIAEPLQIKQATKQGYIEIPPGSVFDASYPDSQTRRGRVQDGGQTSPTLMASGEAPCYYEGVQMVQRPHGFNKGNTHEVSPTVTSSAFQDNNFVEEWKTVVGSKQENSFLGDVNGECPCVTSACGAGGGMTPMVTDASLEQARTDDFREQVRGHQPLHYRIRKLTPRECFRLMGVTEENIDKIQQSGVSQSQQ